jgi:hypothetical protein
VTAVRARLARVRLVRRYRYGAGLIHQVLAVVYAPAKDCPDCAGSGEVIRHNSHDPDNPDPWGEPCWCTCPRRDLTLRIRAVAGGPRPEDPPL